MNTIGKQAMTEVTTPATSVTFQRDQFGEQLLPKQRNAFFAHDGKQLNPEKGQAALQGQQTEKDAHQLPQAEPILGFSGNNVKNFTGYFHDTQEDKAAQTQADHTADKSPAIGQDVLENP